MKRLYRKKKLRMKVLPIGLGWNKCGRVTTSAHFPKLELHWFVNCIYLTGSR